MRLIPFGESFSAVAMKFPAAPLTNMSTLPNFFTTSATTYLQSLMFDTSPGIEWHFRWSEIPVFLTCRLMSSTTAWFFCLLLLMRMTAFAPCKAYSRAISLSMPPRDPPVMRHTLPSSSFFEKTYVIRWTFLCPRFFNHFLCRFRYRVLVDDGLRSHITRDRRQFAKWVNVRRQIVAVDLVVPGEGYCFGSRFPIYYLGSEVSFKIT